jgi:Uma2 family endonuclease
MAMAFAPDKTRRAAASINGRRPTWELARFFPQQGDWTEDDYLELEGRCGDHIRVELSDGRLEVLPASTESHHLIMAYLWKRLDLFISVHAPGVVLVSGTRMRLRLGRTTQFREPDVVYMSARHSARRKEELWEGADLVMEVVSGDRKDRLRDWKIKARDYAAAGIPEYWIVDPYQKVIRVLTLRGKRYRRHGDVKPGDQATSVLLPGFSVSVDAVFAAAEV